MKDILLKRIFLLFCLCFAFLSLCWGDVYHTQAESFTAQQELNENIFEQLGNLDLDALQEYVQGLQGFSDETVVERLYRYIQGEGFDFEGFGRQFLAIIAGNIQELLPAFSCITAITLLCGILSTLKSNFLSDTTADVVFMVAYIGALIPVLAVLTECFSSVKGSVTSIREQMQIVFPIMLTLMAASGGAVSVAIYRPAVAFLSNTLVSLIDVAVLPITLTVIAFSMAGHLFSDLKIGRFTSFFKSINKWIMGVGVSVFGVFFTVQGITSATYDGIARRAAKYAIGTGVPIVGGFLSSGFDLAIAGSTLIKNSLGTMSVFMLLAVIAEPLFLLIAVNLLLRLTSAVTQPFGSGKISDFLAETADNLNYCLAGLLFTAFLYFVSILLIVCSTEAFF